MSAGWTLEEAMTLGRGTERPFRCHMHDDSNASASVNVLKGVWFCYACRAHGSADDKKAPAIADLLSMTEPEKAVRAHQESYLDLFDAPQGYWSTRFPDWLVWHQRLGQDPFTGFATFPVRTSKGRLAGVGRRDNDPQAQPRYKYPSRWSASRMLHGMPTTERGGLVVLTEGAADKESLTEVGITAYGCYGAGIHFPQVELLLQTNPKLVLCGFDMDEAGERATALTVAALEDHVEVSRVQWTAKDPADSPLLEREGAVLAAIIAVSGMAYAADCSQRWSERVQMMKTTYEREQTT